MGEDEKEMLLPDNDTENVEQQTTEENVDEVVEDVETAENTEDTAKDVEETQSDKTLRELIKENPKYKEEFNNIIKSRLSRRERNMSEDIESKYEKLNNVLKYGLGADNIEDATNQLNEFYSAKGKIIPTNNSESFLKEKDLERLAKMDADEFDDEDEIMDEIERLGKKGVDNMTQKEKFMYKFLAEKHETAERESELLKIGAKKETIDSEEFKKFAKKFAKETPIKEVYEYYENSKPKKDYKPAGSMNNTQTKKEKTMYTPDEAKKLTKKDLSDPAVYKALQDSMKSWK